MEKFNPCDVCLYSTTKDSKAAMCYRCDLYKLRVENEYLSEFQSKMQSYIDDSKKDKIIYGLQKCSNGEIGIEEFHDCPYEEEKEPRPCFDNLRVDAFNLVISQKAEIERLQGVKTHIHNLIAHHDFVSSEAYDEYFERTLKKLYDNTKIKVIDATDEDFGAILTCAVRYALGRRTYIVSLVVDFIKPLLPELSKKTLTVMERDIETAGNYGDESVDKPVWMDLLTRVKSELKKRGDDDV